MKRDDRGLVLPSWLVAVSAVLVALALVGFAVSGDREPDVVAQQDGTSTGAGAGDADADLPRAGDSPDETSKRDAGAKPADDKKTNRQDKPRPPDRRSAYVEVYNNSSITGLAAQTTAQLRDSGWQVVATDNWYGEIAGSTVYHPADLTEQAQLLAADIGIDRVLPAVPPMSFDRLTVVLTGAP
ncbi:MAG: LytR C-terminal domain-containing protein [Actinomycetota bacterium]|nr:LytR C-terminal domain-containing protein [Actinomycetota bacterium]